MLKEWKATTHMFGGEEVAQGLHDPNGVVEAGRGDPLHRVLRQQQLGQLLRYHQHHLQHHNNIFCFKIYLLEMNISIYRYIVINIKQYHRVSVAVEEAEGALEGVLGRGR
jgi:hypothetical protein